MSYGPYRYVNGEKYVFGADGRWWRVTTSQGGDDYGVPVASSAVTPHAAHQGAGLHVHPHGHSNHHYASYPPRQSSRVPSARRVNPGGMAYGRHPASAEDDPWQGNNYARELFQGQGGRYFVDADNSVKILTEFYTAAYTAAFFAPEILAAVSRSAGWGLNRVGAFGPTVNRLFWSGSGYWMALRYGNQIGGYAGQTLEESWIGSFVGSMQQFLPQNAATGVMWNWLSTWYAAGAEESIYYFEGPAGYQGNIWLYTEMPILVKRAVSVTVMPYR